MSPQEVTEKLQLSQLKDRIWYVVPSCATTGEGLFEGLVSDISTILLLNVSLMAPRDGCQTTSRRNPRSRSNELLFQVVDLSPIPARAKNSLWHCFSSTLCPCA